MLNTFNKFYFLKNSKQKIKEITENCLACARCKSINKKFVKIKGTLHRNFFNNSSSSDLIGPFELNIDKEFTKIWFIAFYRPVHTFSKDFSIEENRFSNYNQTTRTHLDN